MKRPLSFSLLFLAFSAGVLRSQSDGSLEKLCNGKRGTGDWFGARPALEDRGINLTGKWIGTFYGAFVQPFLQYVIRPNGIGLVQNATVLGLHFGVEF